MSGPIVVDVGNSRIKWGLCSSDHVWSMASLLPDAPDAWDKQWHDWKLERHQQWIIAGVHPQRRDALVEWLRFRTDAIQVVTSAKELPLTIELEHPEKVGIDRLLNAVAANRKRQANVAAVLIGAGTAITVDYLDGNGVFKGGTIFPGFGLMARSLHEHTALLPLVDMDDAILPPGTSTVQAIQAGVYLALVGGIERVIAEYQHRFPVPFEVFLTGGDARHLHQRLRHHVHLWPEMTLEGLLHAHRPTST